jgi:hypothetical protein
MTRRLAILLLLLRAAALFAGEPSVADKRLAAEIEEWRKKVGATPAREAAQWDGFPPLLGILNGETPVDAAERDAARRTGEQVLKDLKKGPSWPIPPDVRLPRATVVPTIDGRVDEAAWERAFTAHGQYAFNTTNLVERPATQWLAMWDEDNLYFAFVCEDDDIIAPVMDRDTAVYSYDCVEMFLLPEPRLGLYWELVISPSGSIYDALNAKKFNGWGGLARTELNIEGLKTAQARTADGYCVEVAIPFRELPGYTRGNRPKRGDTLHWMLVRLDKNASGFTPYAYQPLLSWGHNIWNHARVILD